MHLKNMALLKIAEPRERQFRSVRMAPLYNAVTTRVFPKLKHDRLELKLTGKDDNLRRADFQSLATTAGLRAGDAEAALDGDLQRLGRAIDAIAVPKAIELTDETRKMAAEVRDLWRRRIAAMDKKLCPPLTAYGQYRAEANVCKVTLRLSNNVWVERVSWNWLRSFGVKRKSVRDGVCRTGAVTETVVKPRVWRLNYGPLLSRRRRMSLAANQYTLAGLERVARLIEGFETLYCLEPWRLRWRRLSL
jgi:hypothetical protein